jgi:hypothetical protein
MNSKINIAERGYDFPEAGRNYVASLAEKNYSESMVGVMHGLRQWAFFRAFNGAASNVDYNAVVEPLPTPLMREVFDLSVNGQHMVSIDGGSNGYLEVPETAFIGRVFDLQSDEGRKEANAYFEGTMAAVLQKCDGGQLNAMHSLRSELLNAMSHMHKMSNDPDIHTRLYFWRRDLTNRGGELKGCVDSTICIDFGILQ